MNTLPVNIVRSVRGRDAWSPQALRRMFARCVSLHVLLPLESASRRALWKAVGDMGEHARSNVYVDCVFPPFTNVILKRRMPPDRMAHPVQASMGQKVRPTTPRTIDVVWSPVDPYRIYECFRRGAHNVRSQVPKLARRRLPALPNLPGQAEAARASQLSTLQPWGVHTTTLR